MIRKLRVGLTPKDYLVEFLFGLTAVFGFYLIIAWSSYSPFDNAWAVSSFQPEIINKAGWLGAWVVDLFFVLFGKAGNILPFLLCIAPIYFIRTKRVKGLTWARFGLRMLGFVILMLGLTAFCALLLQNDNNHLAGGVLGGVLVANFFSVFGKFWFLVISAIFSVSGFILCSGNSLIRLLVRFYHWLTMQNESKESPEPETLNQEAEDFSSQTVEMPTAPWQSHLEQPEPVEIDSIQINETETDIPDFSGEEFDNVEHLDNYSLNQDEPLPQVNIVGVNEDWQSQGELHSGFQEPETAVEINEDFSAPTVKVHIPAVNLSDAKPVEPVDFSQEDSATPESDSQSSESQDFIKVQVDKMPQEFEETVQESSHGLQSISIEKAIELFGDHKTLEKPNTPMPSLELLSLPPVQQQAPRQNIQEIAHNIEQQLRKFNVEATVREVLEGPVVTRYDLELQPGMKASKVTGITADLARVLGLKTLRVAETVDGKPYIGIEMPNATRQMVYLREVLDSPEFKNSKALLPMALGKDIAGKAVVIDLAKTPHLLVAGSTGSGKSVGINTMILSLLYRVKPEQVKFIMIDPKVVELSVYNGIPHLLTEVVTDMKKAANALRWCVDEMERRYQLLAKLRVRNIEGYNERIEQYRAEGYSIPDPLWRPSDSMDSRAPALECLSYIVLIVDEFADLMMVAGKQIEELIARLTQKARAVGIHVILATQRPSVDVITGLIKSNIPSRIAFTVVQRNDSRTILDQNGAEALLGRGDMLYLANGTTELVRVHGAFMSDDEVNRVADDWRARGTPNYISEILESQDDDTEENGDEYGSSTDELDPLFDEVVEFVCRTGITSTSNVQRRFKVGFNRAARIMDQLEEQGIVSEMRNGKREILARNNSADY